LDLNFDDIPPLGAPQEVEVSGSERTTFFPIVHALSMEFRLNIRPDAHPEAGYYYRSDHFSLARVGIPAFSVSPGAKYKGHDEAWGLKQAEQYTEKHYHQPSDEVRTITTGLTLFIVEDVFFWGPMMGAAFLSSLPPVLLYLVFQRWVVKGLTLGAVKG